MCKIYFQIVFFAGSAY